MFDIEAFLQSPWLAVMAGIVGQVIVTQRLKFFLPADWSERVRSRVIEFGLALPLGWIPPMVLYAGMNGWTGKVWHTGFWLGFIVWGAGVVIYKGAVRLLAKKDPALAAELSAAVDAERRRKVVRTAAGTRQLRDADVPSADGEETEFYIGEPTIRRKDGGDG